MSMSSITNTTFYDALRLFSVMSKNMRARDRLVKVVQYGCQMLMGYYGSRLSELALFELKTTRRSASTARKAYWLFKWIHHFNETKKLTITEIISQETSLARRFDIIQQLSWVVYFYYENLVFLARNNCFGLKEQKLDFMTNLSWLVGDVACFGSDLIRLVNNYNQKKEIASKLRKITEVKSSKKSLTDQNNSNHHNGNSNSNLDLNLDLGNNNHSNNGNHDKGNEDRNRSKAETIRLALDKFKTLEDAEKGLILSFAIAVFELGVSLHYSGVIKLCAGIELGDTSVGFMGVVSSSLILYESFLNAKRDVFQRRNMIRNL